MELDNKLGLFLGLAIGDALGAPLEFQKANEPDAYLTEYTTGNLTMYQLVNGLMTQVWH